MTRCLSGVVLCACFFTASVYAASHSDSHSQTGDEHTKSGVMSVSNEQQGDGVVARNFWIRLVPPVSSVTAAFGRLGADTDEVLISAQSSRSETVELHTHKMVDGAMKMRQVNSIAVPASGGATLKPGGLHLMLIGLSSPLEEGEMVDLRLEFASGKTLELSIPVVRGKKPPKHNQQKKH